MVQKDRVPDEAVDGNHMTQHTSGIPYCQERRDVLVRSTPNYFYRRRK